MASPAVDQPDRRISIDAATSSDLDLLGLLTDVRSPQLGLPTSSDLRMLP